MKLFDLNSHSLANRLSRSLLQLLAFTSFSALPAIAVAAPSSNSDAISHAQELSQSFEQVAEKIHSSVVTISSVTRAKQVVRRGKHSRKPNDPFFDPYRDFFGDDFFNRMLPPDDQQDFAQQGMGTGVIVDSSGRIVTNNHVVAGADEITVQLQNEKKYKAKLVGTDPRTDVAVIKIDAPDLVPASLGNSDDLRIGEWVIAAGNPFGLTNSITAGIVSAKGRSLMGRGQYEDFIQTDAAINPGNSGGPLLNLNGEVVGINTAIFSKSGGYMGIGFAIPINMVKSVMNSLVKNGRVVRGWIGVLIQPITEEAADSFNYHGTSGALVGQVEKGSPADKGGIRQGDIITAIRGEKIRDVTHLRNMIAATKPGESIDFEIYRDGDSQKITVKVGELKANDSERGESAEEDDSDNEDTKVSTDLGISVETVTKERAREEGGNAEPGVYVTSIEPGSQAESAGLARGDRILSVNGARVNDAKEFHSAIRDGSLKKGFRFVVESAGMQRFVFMRGE